MKNPRLLLILLLALVVRLYHIDFPVAGFAAWRQADTAAMARNFHENGYDILHPQIDWGGNGEGYVETEFPLYQYVVSLIYAVGGPWDAWGRMVSVFCGVLTVYILFLLVRLELTTSIALWSALIYAILPLNIFYSRAYMPESTMLMCTVAGVYFFDSWMRDDRLRNAVLAALLIALAGLLKIVALYIGIPLLFLVWRKWGNRLWTRWDLALWGVAVLGAVGSWYYHAHQIFVTYGNTFGIWMFGTNKWGMFDVLATPKWYNDIFLKSIAERHLTYAGFLPFLAGLFLPEQRRALRLFFWWFAGILFYFGLVAVGNQVHEYYQLPFTIPAAVVMATVFDRYITRESVRNAVRSRNWKVLFLLLCLITLPVLSALRVAHFLKGEQRDSPLFHLATAVQETTAPTDLVVAIDEGDPVILYRCDRKGWHGFPDALTDDLIRSVAACGAVYIVGEKQRFSEPDRAATLDRLLTEYPVVRDGDDFFIVRIPRQ